MVSLISYINRFVVTPSVCNGNYSIHFNSVLAFVFKNDTPYKLTFAY